MTDVWVKKIGAHRGSPRVFLDGPQAVRAGFSPGERFDVEVQGRRVVISRNRDGSRVVSSRTRNDAQLPVIDINSKEMLAIFEGMDAVRVVVAHDKVYLLPLASEEKKRERFNRLQRKMESGEALSIGSLSHGGGILSHAIHRGLQDAGLKADLVFANDIRDDLLTQAIEHNDAWSATSADGAGTSALAVPMQELAQDDWLMAQLPKLEVLEMGLPCSGATRAGISKNKLSKMEDHVDVGHLVHSALVILHRTQPVFVLIENVPLYETSASAQILRLQLRDMGYDCHEAILDGSDFGAMENRVRWCMVGVTRGVEFSFDQLAPAVRVVRRLGELLDESIADDDPRWMTFGHLKDKAVRDRADGKGFKMQTLSPDSTRVPVMRRGYAKAGSTDPLLQHPTDPTLLRKLTSAEHARVKGVPAELVAGLSENLAHQLLGQGIAYQPFRRVGERIGEAMLMSAAARLAAGVRQGVELPNDSEGAEESEVVRRRERMTG